MRWRAIERGGVGILHIDGVSHLIARASSAVWDRGAPNGAQLRLTPRELQIVQLVAYGYANKMVAVYLRISQATVATHLRRIFAKLSVDSRAAMVHQCAHLLAQPDACGVARQADGVHDCPFVSGHRGANGTDALLDTTTLCDPLDEEAERSGHS